MEIPHSPQKGAFEHQMCFAVPAGVTLQLHRDYAFFFLPLSRRLTGQVEGWAATRRSRAQRTHKRRIGLEVNIFASSCCFGGFGC